MKWCRGDGPPAYNPQHSSFQPSHQINHSNSKNFHYWFWFGWNKRVVAECCSTNNIHYWLIPFPFINQLNVLIERSEFIAGIWVKQSACWKDKDKGLSEMRDWRSLLEWKLITHYAVIKEMKFLYEGGNKPFHQSPFTQPNHSTQSNSIDCVSLIGWWMKLIPLNIITVS